MISLSGSNNIKSEETGLSNNQEVITASNNEKITYSGNIKKRQDFVWTGNKCTDWNEDDNWDQGKVPGSQDSIVIPQTDNDPVIDSVIREIGNTYIKEGATLTINNKVGARNSLYNKGTIKINHKLNVNNKLTNNGIIDIENSGTLNIRGELEIKPKGELTSTGTISNDDHDNIIIRSDSSGSGSLILDHSEVKATVERWMQGEEFHVISPPVIGQGIQNFFDNNDNISTSESGGYKKYAMQVYEPAVDDGGGWTDFFTDETTGDLKLGHAYSLRIDNDGVVTFEGELKHDELDREIERPDEDPLGWNGLGNPYACALNISGDGNNFLSENSNNLDDEHSGVWVWDVEAKEYKVINNATSEIPELTQNHIAPGQGFIVKAKETEGGNVTITFDPGMRAHEDPPFRKTKQSTEDWYHIVLEAKNEQENRLATSIVFNKNMNYGLDVGYDAGLFSENPDYKFYSRMPYERNDLDLTIQALPDQWQDEIVIPLGIVNNEGGKVTFSTSSMSLPSYVTPMLEDTKKGEFTDLSKENYTTTVPMEYDTLGRFYLHMTASYYDLGLKAEPAEGGTVEGEGEYPAGKKVEVSSKPNQGWVFVKWTDKDGTISNEKEFVYTMPGKDTYLTANFEKDPTQVEGTESSKITVYPNPTRNNLTVESNEMIKNIRMINISGQVIKNITVDALNKVINVSNTEPGIYFMQIQTKENIYTKRIQVFK